MEPADELLDRVAGLRRVLRRRLRAGLGVPPLRGAQLELLQLVEAEPGVGVAPAAAALHLAPNTVSTLVNQLVAAQMLHREPDPRDRRAVRLRLTGAAVQRLSRWRAARTEMVAEALRRLEPSDVAVLEAALPALARLTGELEG